eukprot:CAMPEP_0183703308 /NCGR_PEP_ID=MMETSP0737-20130205/1092_1 /TAXON_ID=385413 /ORGANISM="Thalassiosira miniscula, Strain CCMP1093" /LENGTH=274 /DNA_ID=CAMNT_0025930035 /DNA_START=12 /DNA_END=836 /DNA_ORIENTATION=+
MDRVVLRAPSVDVDSDAHHNSVPWVASALITALAYAIGANDESYSASPPWPPSVTVTHFSVVIVDFAIVAILFYAITVACRHVFQSRRFVEAAVEVTPFGVQLVSVFGKASSPSSCSVGESPSNTNSSFTTSTRQATNKNSNPHSNTQRKVRAFLPRQQILDVIIMEVVWPHCVWTLVAFRVAKGDVENAMHTADEGESTQTYGNAEDGSILSTRQTSRQISSQHAPTKTSLVQELLQQGRVAIVPAFPEECRGMLSYRECLRVQEEIEGLLGI